MKLVLSVRFFTAFTLAALSYGSAAAQDDPVAYSLTDTQESVSDRQPPAPIVEPAEETSIVDASRTHTEAPLPESAAVWASPNTACGCQTSCQCDNTKKKKEKLTAAMKGAYKGLFYANSFGYLNDPLYDGPYFIGDNLKGLNDGKLDVGGEFRTRYHHEKNHRGLGLTGRDDDFWLTRMRLFANYRITKNVRFYGEYLYADSAGEFFNPRPIEENRGEAQNLFIDAKLFDNDAGALTARVGRQELLFGAQRLVSPLDWANTRRTFDGYRLTYQGENWDVDGFYTNPVRRVAATAGTNQWDSSNTDLHFYGTYLSCKGLDIGALELYYIGFDNETANFSFHTLGSRIAGKGQEFNYEVEGGVQFGQNSDNSDHGAGFLAAGLGRQLTICDWKPTVWAWYDWASGGDAAFVNTGDDSFHHLFPLAHKYNGFMDLFGRRNLNDVNMQFITPLGNKVKFLLWYHYFFLDELTTPYNVNMTPFSNNTAGSRDLGHEIDCLFTVNLNPRNSVIFGYSFFDAGEYYQTTAGVPETADAEFLYFQYQSRF